MPASGVHLARQHGFAQDTYDTVPLWPGQRGRPGSKLNRAGLIAAPSRLSAIIASCRQLPPHHDYRQGTEIRMNEQTEDLLLIEEDEPEPADSVELPPWNVLVVDDDDQVHAVTRLVLRSFRFRERGLRLISVMEFISTQNAHVFICDTLTVTRDLSSGDSGEFFRSSTP